MKTIEQITRVARRSPDTLVCHFADGDYFVVNGDESVLDAAIEVGDEVCFDGHVVEPLPLPVMNFQREPYRPPPRLTTAKGGGHTFPKREPQQHIGRAGGLRRKPATNDVEPLTLPQLLFDPPQPRSQHINNKGTSRANGTRQSPPDKSSEAQEPRPVRADDGRFVVPLPLPRLF